MIIKNLLYYAQSFLSKKCCLNKIYIRILTQTMFSFYFKRNSDSIHTFPLRIVTLLQLITDIY